VRLFAVVLLLASTPLTAQGPLDARGWINRGVQEFKAANYPKAVEAFQHAVDSDPSNVTAHLYLGTAWMQQYIPGAESFENNQAAAAAGREFLKVLDTDPGNKTAMAYLGSLNVNQKKWEEAQGWYQKLAAADPGNATAWYSMGFIAWSRWYPAYGLARASLGMKLEDPGPMPSGAVKADLRARYWPILEGGLQDLQQALLIDPRYDDAMAYMNLLIRERADLRDTAEEYRQDIAVANDWVDKALATKRAKAQERSDRLNAATQPPPPPAGIQVGSTLGSGMLLRKVAPVYPPEARRAGTEGIVHLSVVIGRDGAVKDVVLLGGESALAKAAIDAVRQWVYKPTMLNGEPVEVRTTVDVPFTLHQ
jgi:TonB family protein